MSLPLRQYLQLLRRHLGSEWPKLVMLAALLLTTTGLSVFNPQLLRLFIDAALASAAGQETQAGAEGTLTWAALTFLGGGAGLVRSAG